MCFIPYHGSSRAYWSLTSFKTILLDCIVTAVISACTLKNVSKLVNFCVAILISMEENMQHFQHIMLYLFKKGKIATETQKKKGKEKDLCSVWRRYCDRMCRKQFVKFLGTIDILAKLFFAMGPSYALEDVQQHPWPLPNRSQQQEIANILEISKSIKLLVKMKNVSFILWKKTMWTLWPTQYLLCKNLFPTFLWKMN